VKRVLLCPGLFHEWCGNRIFNKGTSFEGVYRSAFARWREDAACRGYAIDTWDMHSLAEADVLWFLDLPRTRHEFEAIRGRIGAGCRLVLQVLETPAIAWSVFHRANTARFDAVVSYEPPATSSKADTPRRFQYRLPYRPVVLPENPPFAQRKGLLALNSNRVEGPWAPRQLGIGGLPVIGKALSGWAWTWRDLFPTARSDLYAGRRRLLRIAEQCHSDFVDLFGRSWNGESISWCPLYPNRPYRCWKGIHNGSKLKLASNYRFLLAYENHRASLGYISEKIFDAFSAGTVPVYLGDEHIHEVVPPESFVDARLFPDPLSLLDFLANCPESRWREMREAGREFLASPAFESFSDQAFAMRMTEVLDAVITQPHNNATR
jgi:hypothetical protein